MTIKNRNIHRSAAIAYSKLALTGAILNADIATAAAIARSKVAVGTADHVVINSGTGALSSEAALSGVRGGTGANLSAATAGPVITNGSGVMSSEATLAKARGGCGADMTNVVFPASGTVVAQQVATGTLTTEQVLALNATPITLIAAPAAGYINVIDEVQLFLDFNSAAYVADAGDDLTIQYATSNTAVWQSDNDTDAFLTAAADARLFAKVAGYNTASATSFDEGNGDAEAIEITVANSEVITGDSPIKWRITYRTVALLA